MSKMNVTMLNKKASPGEFPHELVVKHCTQCGAKWVEPRDKPGCTCDSVPPEKPPEPAE